MIPARDEIIGAEHEGETAGACAVVARVDGGSINAAIAYVTAGGEQRDSLGQLELGRRGYQAKGGAR